jgi:hypothetical protein
LIGCEPNEEIRRIAAGLLRIISGHKTLGSYLKFSQEVAAGVDMTVIRSWLGHISPDTTSHYAQANLESKRKALNPLDCGQTQANSRDGGATAASLSGSTRCSLEAKIM